MALLAPPGASLEETYSSRGVPEGRAVETTFVPARTARTKSVLSFE